MLYSHDSKNSRRQVRNRLPLLMLRTKMLCQLLRNEHAVHYRSILRTPQYLTYTTTTGGGRSRREIHGTARAGSPSEIFPACSSRLPILPSHLGHLACVLLRLLCEWPVRRVDCRLSVRCLSVRCLHSCKCAAAPSPFRPQITPCIVQCVRTASLGGPEVGFVGRLWS
jgi:hypothetical protein